MPGDMDYPKTEIPENRNTRKQRLSENQETFKNQGSDSHPRDYTVQERKMPLIYPKIHVCDMIENR